MPIAKTSRLMAVNTILSAGGEPPITSLSSQASVSSTIAQQILEECINNVLTTGWHFNTRKTVTLNMNAENEIEITEDIIRVDFPGHSDLQNQYAIRSGKLYNKLTGLTNDFTDGVVATIVTLLEWEDIPEAFRLYITKKAARLYVSRHVSDPSLLRAVVADEAEAQINAQREDIATSNSRIFGPDFSRIVDRGKPLDWIN
jgi:hypothetical protein